MNKIPKKFKLASLEFTVKYVNSLKDGDIFGLFDCATNTIYLAKTVKDFKDKVIIPSDEMMLNTFYHELFHAFNYYYNTELDEGIAQSFSNFMNEYINTKE